MVMSVAFGMIEKKNRRTKQGGPPGLYFLSVMLPAPAASNQELTDGETPTTNV
jgi:hypothetical protein